MAVSLAGALIGRSAERAALEAAYAAAAAGRPGIALLSGDPGLGRTAVLDHLVRHAGEAGGRGVIASCFPVGQRAAYGVLGSLLLALVGVAPATPAGDVARTLERFAARLPEPERHLALLGRLVGVESGSRALGGMQPAALAFATFAALDDLIRLVAAERPLVLAIDDVHWADKGSVAWVETLGQRLSATRGSFPVLIAASALAGSLRLGQPASALVSLARLELAPLSLIDAMEVASRWLGAKVASQPPSVRTLVKRVLDRAAGNPGYIQETLRALEDGGTLRQEHGAWSAAEDSAAVTLPAWIESAVAARLMALPAALAEKLRVAAVIGPTVPPEVMRRLLEDGFGRAVADLIRLKLLVETQSGHLQFASEALRSSCYEGTAEASRQSLHAQVGEALEQLAGDGERAFKYLVLSGDRARAANMPEQAREAYKEALVWADRLAERGKAPPDHDLLLALATAEIQVGASDAALATLGRIRRRDPAYWRTKAVAHERKGLLQDALDACIEGERAAAAAPLELARSLAASADILRRLGRFAEAIDRGERARTLFGGFETPAEAAVVHGVIGLCHHRLGDWERALSCHNEALRLRERVGDQEGTANSLNNIGMIEASLGRLGEAEADYGRAFQIFCKIGNRPGATMALNNLGDVHLKQGDVDRAEKCLLEAKALADEMNFVTEQITTSANLAEVYTKRGDTQAAIKLLEGCAGLAVRIGQREFLPDLHAGRAQAYLAGGDLRSARRAFQEAGDAARSLANFAMAARLEDSLRDLERRLARGD
ncbi:MAG: tetratricopeptide repeat protein [Candidatus Sericytochromatia bacterium]|nr:tetratricopeptide repeat protein [Candidatus Tanganyikabacteria bacterium]